MITLGKIVKSNSHTDYVCQIYGKHETAYLPLNTDYALGTFVSISLETDAYLVGLIYDTVLMNPDFGRLGPRLSTETDLALFAPDYLNERATLIGVAVIGQVNGDGVRQGVPALAASNDAVVQQLSSEQIHTFHHASERFRLAYLPLLIQRPDPLARQVAMTVIRRLIEQMPEQTALLTVIADDLLWQLQINAMGAR